MSMVTSSTETQPSKAFEGPMERVGIEKKMSELKLSELTLKHLHIRDDLGEDLCSEVRTIYRDQAEEFSVEIELPERFHVDLSHTALTKFPTDFIRNVSPVRIDLSYSKIERLPGCILEASCEELYLRAQAGLCSVIIDAIIQKRDTKEEKVRSCAISKLQVLDLSDSNPEDIVPVIDGRLTFLRFDKAFLFLKKLFLSNCGLKWIPLYLDIHRTNLRWLDLSNNEIACIEARDYTKATSGMFCPCAPESFPKIKGKLWSISNALQADLIVESQIRGVYIGKDKPEEAIPLHLDLRNNPLDKETIAIFKKFTRVKLDSNQRLVCFPGGFFVYYTKKSTIPNAAKV